MKKNKASHHATLAKAPLLALGAVLMLGFSPGALADALFGSSERMSQSLDEFPKWNKVLERSGDGEDDECTGARSTCKWREFLQSIESLSRKEQIDRVNNYHNKHRYIQDINNWGVRDYWETLLEFLTRDGDCEDYAISKYMALKYLGFNTDDMRIVILKDENIRQMHAVLAVYEDDKIYILDNQTKSVLEDTRIHHYTPIYSINEHAWWRHLPNG